MTNKHLPKLLIAEDEADINKMLKNYFTRRNYSVAQATDGHTAYNELKNDSYDVCILDLAMPFKSGVEILQALYKEKEITTGIVVFTGKNDLSTIIKVMRLGAHNYIPKPYNIEELVMAVESAVGHRIMKKENNRYKYHLEQEVEKKTAEIKKNYLDIVDAFASSIEMRDPYTWGHSSLVSKIAILIGEEIKLDKNQLEELRIGGLLHDIGKIGISDKVLNKPGKLTKEEFKEIKKHPVIGYNIIKKISSLKKIIPHVLYHQERYDGKGYPKGLKGKEIPVEGRILTIADTFAAMICNRPYRKALSVNKAYNVIIDNSGKQFDPDIVEVFIKLWENDKIKKSYKENII